MTWTRRTEKLWDDNGEPTAGYVLTGNGSGSAPTWQVAGGGGGGATDPEIVRDTIAAALVAGAGVTIVHNDAANTITITCSLTQYTDENARDALAAALVAGVGLSIVHDDPGDTITVSSRTRGAQGTVDFGTAGDNDYAEVTIAATWVSASHRLMVMVRGGTTDHPIGDEDAAIEELHVTITAITAATSVTVGVHAPNGTWGQYLVDIVGAV